MPEDGVLYKGGHIQIGAQQARFSPTTDVAREPQLNVKSKRQECGKQRTYVPHAGAHGARTRAPRVVVSN